MPCRRTWSRPRRSTCRASALACRRPAHSARRICAAGGGWRTAGVPSPCGAVSGHEKLPHRRSTRRVISHDLPSQRLSLERSPRTVRRPHGKPRSSRGRPAQGAEKGTPRTTPLAPVAAQLLPASPKALRGAVAHVLRVATGPDDASVLVSVFFGDIRRDVRTIRGKVV